MPVAVMTIGTIIGEIRMPVMKPRNGISGRDSPTEASVPSTVARIVALTPTNTLLRSASIHWPRSQLS